MLAKKVQRGVELDQEKPVLKLKEGENQLLLKVVNGSGGYAFTFKRLGAAPPEILEIRPVVLSDSRSKRRRCRIIFGRSPQSWTTRARRWRHRGRH